jgi:hypothetical protein
MSCTRRGFLKTVGAAMVGLGLTRLDPLRTFAASSAGSLAGEGVGGGPADGPYSIDSLRARAVDAANWAGDRGLAHELSEVCCWAPAAAAIRSRPLAVQEAGADYFFRDYPGGDQLAQVLLYSNNTAWRFPRFQFNPESLLKQHYDFTKRPDTGLRTEVLTPSKLNGQGANASLNLVLDRETGDRLALAADRAQPMWASLSILTGTLLDPTDDLSRRLSPTLSLTRAADRAFARSAAVKYNQVVIGAAQRAVWSDQLDGPNAALPLLQLSAAGYLPLGEEDGRFYLLRVAGSGSHLTGYRAGSA